MKHTHPLLISLAAAVAVAVSNGCSPAGQDGHGTQGNHGHEHARDHEHGHAHGHKAAHGGSLHALGTCENGHAEVRLTDGTLELWFVGGGSDTEKAVRIPDAGFTLHITPAGTPEAKPLALTAKPSELAGEKAGDCSHFTGRADWLKGVEAFTAAGEVTFRGRRQAVRIEHPSGYDPD